MTTPRRSRVGDILFTQDEIRRRVEQLGKAISATYGETPITAIGVLKGAIFFLSDLARTIDSPLVYDFYQVSTYGASTSPERPATVSLTSQTPLTGRHVLLVEDIIDTGRTLHLIRGIVLAQRPASLRVCVLLDKVERREVEVPIDWTGFVIPDRFVIGYGLDHAERFRNLPYLAVLDPTGETEGPRPA